MGARIVWARDLPERGRCYPNGIIVIRHGMSERRTLSTLAHELGHHYYGDPHCTPPANRRAWRWAAHFLIQPHEYAEAEIMDPSPGGIARHLGVTVDVVCAYQKAA